jgi:hypothetical protein
MGRVLVIWYNSKGDPAIRHKTFIEETKNKKEYKQEITSRYLRHDDLQVGWGGDRAGAFSKMYFYCIPSWIITACRDRIFVPKFRCLLLSSRDFIAIHSIVCTDVLTRAVGIGGAARVAIQQRIG